MIKWSKDLQVHLYSNFVDMRKQMDGLLMIVQEHIPESPKPNTLYLFYNRHLDKVKCLLWDNNGFILICELRPPQGGGFNIRLQSRSNAKAKISNLKF